MSEDLQTLEKMLREATPRVTAEDEAIMRGLLGKVVMNPQIKPHKMKALFERIEKVSMEPVAKRTMKHLHRHGSTQSVQNVAFFLSKITQDLDHWKSIKTFGRLGDDEDTAKALRSRSNRKKAYTAASLLIKQTITETARDIAFLQQYITVLGSRYNHAHSIVKLAVVKTGSGDKRYGDAERRLKFEAEQAKALCGKLVDSMTTLQHWRSIEVMLSAEQEHWSLEGDEGRAMAEAYSKYIFGVRAGIVGIAFLGASVLVLCIAGAATLPLAAGGLALTILAELIGLGGLSVLQRLKKGGEEEMARWSRLKNKISARTRAVRKIVKAYDSVKQYPEALLEGWGAGIAGLEGSNAEEGKEEDEGSEFSDEDEGSEQEVGEEEKDAPEEEGKTSEPSPEEEWRSDVRTGMLTGEWALRQSDEELQNMRDGIVQTLDDLQYLTSATQHFKAFLVQGVDAAQTLTGRVARKKRDSKLTE